MAKFKVGDRIEIINRQNNPYCSSTLNDSEIGKLGTVTNVNSEEFVDHIYFKIDGSDDQRGCCPDSNFKLITTNNNNMNIKEKFALAFKSEPEKTFRKTGITNGDDLLTEEGSQIFLSWLLKKNGADFKKEVVDLLVEDAKSE